MSTTTDAFGQLSLLDPDDPVLRRVKRTPDGVLGGYSGRMLEPRRLGLRRWVNLFRHPASRPTRCRVGRHRAARPGGTRPERRPPGAASAGSTATAHRNASSAPTLPTPGGNGPMDMPGTPRASGLSPSLAP